MLPREIQRIVLLIGMAATGYLLILAWNNDMEAAKVPTVYSDAPLTSANQKSASVQEAQQPIADDFAPLEADIPPIPVKSTPGAIIDADKAGNSERLVKVETRVLQVWIDLLGGDIVRVQLPDLPDFLRSGRNTILAYGSK